MSRYRGLHRAFEALELSARGLSHGRHYAIGIDNSGRAYVVALTRQARAIITARAEMIRELLSDPEA